MSVFPRTDNASNNAHSATDAKSTIATGHGGTRIVHFDATLVGKNKMREKALAQGGGQENQPATDTVRAALLAQDETNPPTTSENKLPEAISEINWTTEMDMDMLYSIPMPKHCRQTPTNAPMSLQMPAHKHHPE